VITRRRALSLGIAAAALTLASAPLPGLRRPLLVAVGSELEQPLQQLVPLFERRHPGIDLRWQVQGAQDMVNQNQEGRPDRARVLIPSNREQLQAFQAALAAQGEPAPFSREPKRSPAPCWWRWCGPIAARGCSRMAASPGRA